MVILTYNAHMKCSSSCLKVELASRSAIRNVRMEASFSLLVRDLSRCSSSSERALSSFSLLRTDFSRRSSSVYVIRCNRRESELEGVLWIVNRDIVLFGPAESTRLRFCRRAGIGSTSDAVTVMLHFNKMDLRWKKLKAYPDDF